MTKKLDGRLHWLRAGRAALALPSRSVWQRMARMWPSLTRKVRTQRVRRQGD